MSIQRQSILFISGIDRSINENHLFELFNEFPITYIKIAKSHRTKEPFGYGFVGFKSIGKAEEALTKLNYTKLGKKTLRISWFSREPINPRTSTNNNIFVKKFDLNTTHREFHNYFAKFGNIISAKLEEDEEGEVIGYGFVLYDNEESAKLAITETNSTMWKGRRIYVGPFIKKRPKTESSFNTIYVKNIPKVTHLLIRLLLKKILEQYLQNTGK